MARLRVLRLVVSLAALVILTACGSDAVSTISSGAVSGAEQAGGVTIINWQSLGCEEPAPLEVEESEALLTDAGLAADSVADTNGLGRDEAMRRLMLQTVLGERLGEIRSAESDRVARTELQHEPYFAAIATLTGTGEVSGATRDVLCRTPELEVRLGAQFTQDELTGETVRLSQLMGDFGSDVPTFGATNGRLEFTTINDATRDRLDAFLAENTTYPYVINSLGIPPLVLDPNIPFPLLDLTGKTSSGVGLHGLLTIEGPCVYLSDALLILPARETSWNAATGVLNTGGGDVRSGEQVNGGGNDYRGELSELDQPPDPSCRLDGGVLQGSVTPIDPNATPLPPPPPFPPEDEDG